MEEFLFMVLPKNNTAISVPNYPLRVILYKARNCNKNGPARSSGKKANSTFFVFLSS
jgi:hypothetical protein